VQFSKEGKRKEEEKKSHAGDNPSRHCHAPPNKKMMP